MGTRVVRNRNGRSGTKPEPIRVRARPEDAVHVRMGPPDEGHPEPRPRKRKPGRWAWRLGWLCLIGLAGGLGAGLCRYVLTAEEFRVRELNILGTRRASPDEIAAYLRCKPGDNLLLANTKELRKQAESSPWVRSARVEKKYPGVLDIHVEERVPVALLYSPVEEGFFQLDSEGMVLPMADAEDLRMLQEQQEGATVLPIVTGMAGWETYFGSRLPVPEGGEPVTRLVELWREHPALRGELAEVHLHPQYGYIATPAHRVRHVRYGYDSLAEKTRSLARTWDFLARNEIVCEYIDLRFQAQGVVLKPEFVTDSRWMQCAERERTREVREPQASAEAHGI